MVELYTSTSAPNEPKSYEDAKASADASKWISAMKEEIDTLEKRSTWEVVKRPKDKPVVSCKWVYRMKLNEAGEIVRYKARLVARGFSQTYGVDCKDTFAPVTLSGPTSKVTLMKAVDELVWTNSQMLGC